MPERVWAHKSRFTTLPNLYKVGKHSQLIIINKVTRNGDPWDLPLLAAASGIKDGGHGLSISASSGQN